MTDKTLKVTINTEILNWACGKAGLDISALLKCFPKFEMWQKGIAQPTLKQLEDFAKISHVPVGVFFLSDASRIPEIMHQMRQETYLAIFDTFRKYYKDDKLYGGTGAIVFDDLIEIAEDLQEEWGIENWYKCREK